MRVGHAQRIGDGALTGTTVVVPGPDGAVAGVDVRGGGPGTRETDALDPRTLVDRVHAVVLSGGSAYGLAAATGVMDALGDAGVGFRVGAGPAEVVPIVPAAVVFDLGRGGDFRARPDAALGAAALAAAVEGPSPQGVVGAGTGALVGGLKGGVGTASETTASGTVTALCVVNAAGSAVDPRTGQLWADPHLTADDAVPPALPDDRSALLARLAAAAAPPTLNTTIGVIWTDATLSVAQCTKLAAVAHDGLARAIRPAHGMTDGDTFFGLATTQRGVPDLPGLQAVLAAGADTVTRAVGNAVLAAATVTTRAGAYRSYRDVVAGVSGVSGVGLRVATWNLWWRHGDPERRAPTILAALRELDADVVALQEVWWHAGGSFADELAAELGMHAALRPSRDPSSWISALPDTEGYGIGNAVLARDPLGEPTVASLPAPSREGAGRTLLDVVVATPGGSCRVVTVHLTSTPASALRCDQVRAVAAHVAAAPRTDLPPIVLGDFNAEADADEMRLLEGLLTAPAEPGLLLINTRRWAAEPDAPTWNPANPHVAATGSPPVRIDHLLVGLGRGTVPVRVEHAGLFGDRPVDGVWPSDHAGVVVDLAVGDG